MVSDLRRRGWPFVQIISRAVSGGNTEYERSDAAEAAKNRRGSSVKGEFRYNVNPKMRFKVNFPPSSSQSSEYNFLKKNVAPNETKAGNDFPSERSILSKFCSHPGPAGCPLKHALRQAKFFLHASRFVPAAGRSSETSRAPHPAVAWCGSGSTHLPCSRISAISRASASACGMLYCTHCRPT
jgi:hypothetical protein